MIRPRDFLQQFTFALSSDLVPRGSISVPWASDQPQEWGQEQQAIPLHTRPLCLATSQDEKFCVVGTIDGILVYNLDKMQLVHAIAYDAKFFQVYIRALPANSDVSYLVVARARTLDSNDKYSYLMWELRTDGQAVAEKPIVLGIPSVASHVIFSPAEYQDVTLSYSEHDGPEVEQPEKIRYEPRQHNAQPTRVVSYNLINRVGTIISRHEDEVVWIGTSPDGNKLAAIDRVGVLKFCSTELEEIPRHVENGPEPDGGTRDFACFSHDSTLLAVHQKNSHIYIYDVRSGHKVRDFRMTQSVNVSSTQTGMREMKWSPDGRYLSGIGVDATVHVWTWDASKVDEMVWKLGASQLDRDWLSQSSLQWAQIPREGSGKTALLAWKGNESGINVYDLEGQKKWRFEAKKSDRAHMVRVNGTGTMVLLAGSSRVISADVDSMLRVWRVVL